MYSGSENPNSTYRYSEDMADGFGGLFFDPDSGGDFSQVTKKLSLFTSLIDRKFNEL